MSFWRQFYLPTNSVTAWKDDLTLSNSSQCCCCSSRKVKVKVCTLAIVPLTWVRLVIRSALQSRKWELTGMSQWCRSGLCGHSLPALTDNWTHSAASKHTIAPISHTRLHPVAIATTFPVLLRVGGWVGLSTQQVSNLLKVACSGPGVSQTCNLSVASPIFYH